MLVEDRPEFLGRRAFAAHGQLRSTDVEMSSTSDQQPPHTVLRAWLDDPAAGALELQNSLLRLRLERGDESPLLSKALHVVAEATSANWHLEALRDEIAKLLEPAIFTAPEPRTPLNETTVTTHPDVAAPALQGIRVA